MRAVAVGSAFLFASGFCALVYQTVWVRELRSILGASTPATSAVLALFMGGLGFGALVVGRRVDRSPSALSVYGNLELAVAVLAAVSPIILDVVKAAYLGAGGSAALGPFATPVRLLLASLVMVLPALLMGGTLPAMARAIRQDGDPGRHTLALVYGTNTLGAVAGVLCTTFVFFEVFGLRATLWLTAGVNAILGIVARSVARTWASGPVAAATEATRSPSHWGLLLAAFVAGCAFLMFELVWYRLMAPVLGGTTYSFSVILAMALAGIGLGGLLYAVSPLRPTWRALGVTCCLEALLLVGPCAVGDDFIFFAWHLREFAAASFGLLVGSWGAILAWFVLPAAVVSGYQFPLLVALVAETHQIGADTGRVYAANTLGAIIGSLLGGLVLIPAIGAHPTGVAAGALLAAVGIVALWRSRGSAGAQVACVLTLVVVTLGWLSARGPAATWATTAVGAGRARVPPPTARERTLHHRSSEAVLIRRGDGLESSVAVIAIDGLSVLVNGKSDGNSMGDAETQIGVTMVPAILRERSMERGFVIGLGTGQSAGWLAAIPSMVRVDVAEIEPGIIDFARDCGPTNMGVVDNPKARILVGDGRELLQVSPDTFDIIMSEPSNPYRAGIAGFYTEDFYALARQKLTPDGIFVQWMQGYEVEAATIQTAIATLRQVFPSVLIWRFAGNDLMFMASKEPISIVPSVVSRRLDEEPWRTAFQRIFLFEQVDDIFSLLVGGEPLATALAEGWEGGINTDDLPVLEFAFARSVGRRASQPVQALTTLAAATGTARIEGLGIDWERARQVRDARADLMGTSDAGVALAGRLGAFRRAVRDPTSALDELAAVLPTEAATLALLRASTPDARRVLLPEVTERLRADPWLMHPLGRQLMAALPTTAAGAGEEVARMLAEPFPGWRLELARREAWLLTHQGRPRPDCLEHFRTLPPAWTPALLAAHAECEAAVAAATTAARAAHSTWLADEPTAFHVMENP